MAKETAKLADICRGVLDTANLNDMAGLDVYKRQFY